MTVAVIRAYLEREEAQSCATLLLLLFENMQ
jgi:hypothetical protein